ncbi:dentin sialophosphoprotein-like [Ambystoma mexicanum]|uniref:dentin sialophosphoprotein-like n=1 Tax=Ambystoma mexicanum TaxID=8296 RepID=UPI0037E87367
MSKMDMLLLLINLFGIAFASPIKTSNGHERSEPVSRTTKDNNALLVTQGILDTHNDGQNQTATQGNYDHLVKRNVILHSARRLETKDGPPLISDNSEKEASFTFKGIFQDMRDDIKWGTHKKGSETKKQKNKIRSHGQYLKKHRKGYSERDHDTDVEGTITQNIPSVRLEINHSMERVLNVDLQEYGSGNGVNGDLSPRASWGNTNTPAADTEPLHIAAISIKVKRSNTKNKCQINKDNTIDSAFNQRDCFLFGIKQVDNGYINERKGNGGDDLIQRYFADIFSKDKDAKSKVEADKDNIYNRNGYYNNSFIDEGMQGDDPNNTVNSTESNSSQQGDSVSTEKSKPGNKSLSKDSHKGTTSGSTSCSDSSGLKSSSQSSGSNSSSESSDCSSSSGSSTSSTSSTSSNSDISSVSREAQTSSDSSESSSSSDSSDMNIFNNESVNGTSNDSNSTNTSSESNSLTDPSSSQSSSGSSESNSSSDSRESNSSSDSTDSNTSSDSSDSNSPNNSNHPNSSSDSNESNSSSDSREDKSFTNSTNSDSLRTTNNSNSSPNSSYSNSSSGPNESNSSGDSSNSSSSTESRHAIKPNKSKELNSSSDSSDSSISSDSSVSHSSSDSSDSNSDSDSNDSNSPSDSSDSNSSSDSSDSSSSSDSSDSDSSSDSSDSDSSSDSSDSNSSSDSSDSSSSNDSSDSDSSSDSSDSNSSSDSSDSNSSSDSSESNQVAAPKPNDNGFHLAIINNTNLNVVANSK